MTMNIMVKRFNKFAGRLGLAKLMIVSVIIAFASLAFSPARAEETNSLKNYSPKDVVTAGEKFFGSVSTMFASIIEQVTSKFGQPNGYIYGSDGGVSLVGGVTYGEGVLTTKNYGQTKVFWQGPSVGYDFGVQGSKVFMLVYKLKKVEDIFTRVVGVEGSGYLVGGMGFNVMTSGDLVVVPIRSGLGARLGVNVGYLKFTPASTWNPF